MSLVFILLVLCFCVTCVVTNVCILGVPVELPPPGPAGGGEGLVQRGATLGSSANPDGS